MGTGFFFSKFSPASSAFSWHLCGLSRSRELWARSGSSRQVGHAAELHVLATTSGRKLPTSLLTWREASVELRLRRALFSRRRRLSVLHQEQAQLPLLAGLLARVLFKSLGATTIYRLTSKRRSRLSLLEVRLGIMDPVALRIRLSMASSTLVLNCPSIRT